MVTSGHCHSLCHVRGFLTQAHLGRLPVSCCMGCGKYLYDKKSALPTAHQHFFHQEVNYERSCFSLVSFFRLALGPLALLLPADT